MKHGTTHKLTFPAIAMVLLCAQAAETWQRPRAQEAEPYHQMVLETKAEVEDSLRTIGAWHGEDGEVVDAAVRLLRPNFIYNRQYRHQTDRHEVGMLLVHCKDARDLVGHYPPRCYPNQGFELTQAIPREWEVEGQTIQAMEYHFSTEMFGRTSLIVHNFIVMPDGRFARDMAGVGSAAGDYTRRFYGAGQVQVVFAGGTMRPEERDATTQTMIEAHMPVIDAIRTGAEQ